MAKITPRFSIRTYEMGQHRPTVRGWWGAGNQWHADTAIDAVQCATCSLSLVTHRALIFMAENSISRMTVDGAEFHWLV